MSQTSKQQEEAAMRKITKQKVLEVVLTVALTLLQSVQESTKDLPNKKTV